MFDLEKTQAEAVDMSLAELRQALQTLHLEYRDAAGERREEILATIETFDAEVLRRHPAEKPLTVIGPRTERTTEQRTKGGYELRAPSQSKEYRELFGNQGGFEWPDKNTNFFSALFSGRHHEGLITRAMTEGVPSSGGFLVPVEVASQIHNVALESELVLPRCFVQPMRTNEIKIPAMAIGSHASSLMGGFVASFSPEAGTLTDANPTARSMTLVAKKLVGYLRYSSELSADIPGGFEQIISICARGLAWYRDYYALNGTGAGQPLGIYNSPCVVTQAPEGGQGTAIVYENIVGMMAKMYPGSFKNAIWIAHNSCIPSLLSLSLAIGTGGAPMPMVTESNGTFRLMTKEIIFTEKVPTLGAAGDLTLIDFSQFVFGLREEQRFDVSNAPYFGSDELAARLITRFDFQSLWGEPLTLADGTTQVSPVVVLGAR